MMNRNTNSRNQSNDPSLVRAVYLACLGSAVAILLWSYSGTERKQKSESTAVTERPSVDLEQIASVHLSTCHERIADASKRHTEPVVELLNRAQIKASKFSKAALSFASKWRLIADAVPYTKGDRNEVYLREQFESMVLQGSELEDAIEESIVSFLQEIRSLENQMLVDLRADLEDFPQVDWSKWKDQATMREQFDLAISTATESSQQDFKTTVGSQLISLIAGEVLTQVAVRFGVSAGVLGTGVASGWATLGIGVVAGIVIDQVISTVWKYWDNPEHELTEQIQSQLQDLQRLICEGDETTQGLRQHYARVSEERDILRREAIQNLLKNIVPAP